MRWLNLLAWVALVAVLLLLWPRQRALVHQEEAGMAVVREQMSGTAMAGFRRVTEPRPFTFPRDHGPHEGYRTEWWYLTGSLQADDGRRFGVQWTLFRSLLHPEPTTGLADQADQAWQAEAAYMLHLGLSDVAGARFLHHEAFARGVAPIAGARTEPQPAAWMDANRFARQADGSWQLTAVLPEAGYELVCRPTRAPVLNGQAGFSQKGAGVGNASYYYSWPFLATNGHVLLPGGERVAVTGQLWLDREWSTSALDPDQAGWDWLALHLADGRSLMTYRLRDQAGRAGPQSQGTIAHPDGRTEHLGPEDFRMQPTDWWTSPQTGRRWPIGWRVTVPAAALDLQARALLPDQEHRGRYGYWEGLVEASSAADAAATLGHGYLELVGYEAPGAGGEVP